MTSADERAARFEVLVDELRSMLRETNADVPEEALLMRAVHIAACRLAGGDMFWHVVG